MSATQVVLPPDVYDALKESAEKFGGIGAGRYWDDRAAPLCIRGHGMTVDGRHELQEDGRVTEAIWFATAGSRVALMGGIACPATWNDAIVGNVNHRKRRIYNARISWAEFCAEGNVVRGES